MKRITLLVALLGLLLVAAPHLAAAHEEEGEDDGVDEKDVVVLTDKNFDAEMKKAKFALVGGRGGDWSVRDGAPRRDRRSHRAHRPPCRSSSTLPVRREGGWGCRLRGGRGLPLPCVPLGVLWAPRALPR